MSTEKGLLVRDGFDDEGQIPSPSVSPTYSPDVICYQSKLLYPVDAEITYNSGKQIAKDFIQGITNNFYIRTKNISGNTLAGKVKAFYAPLNLLYMPHKWIPLSNITKKTELQLVDSTYIDNPKAYAGLPAGAVGINRDAFVLFGVEDPTAHHCVMGLASNKDGTFLELPEKFADNDALCYFLRNNREIAYHNIVIRKMMDHTTTLPVNIGSHDESMRRFVMSVEVQKGVETLKNATLLMQSTDAACPFSFEYEMNGRDTQYGCEVKIPAGYEGFMNFSVSMKDYIGVAAVLHIQNIMLNAMTDKTTPDVQLSYPAASVLEAGTKIGDFTLCLGACYEDVPKPSTHRLLEMPTILVQQQM